ncbi:MAG: lipid-A-disaccharide synthase [Alphaproteobacteria bacterium]|nr:lipid-A-disaccharide synthase [Alphaproteobacteria bacterium]
MNKTYKIYLIAGEPSGDALGARFMRAMKKKLGDEVEFFGLGGENMEKEGLKSLFDISDLAIMGLIEVIPSIPKVLRRIRETVADIKKVDPDVVITIDSWSFASRVQQVLRKQKLNILQVHYVAPQVWAWKKKRARTMYKYVDHLLTLLPQEPQYFIPYGLPSTFVGHPVIESPAAKGDGLSFRHKYKIDDNKNIICVLPGSRHNEVARLLPIFIASCKLLKAEEKDLFFVIPAVKTVVKEIRKIVSDCGVEFLIVEESDDRHNAMCTAKAAIAASGTVALELAITGTPHIIAYRLSPLTAFLAKRLLKIKFVNLSNILLNRELVPELLLENCNPQNIAAHIKNYLHDEKAVDKQKKGFEEVKSILGFSSQTPSDNACDVVLKLINEKSS